MDKKKQVFYVHGGSAFSDYEDYIQHLKTGALRSPTGLKTDFWPLTLRPLLGEGYEIFTPSMPNSNDAKYEEWKIWFERHLEFLYDGTIFVGWSLGAMFLVKYLLENTLPIKNCPLILLATPVLYLKDGQSGEDGGTFNFDTNKLTELAKKVISIHALHSEDDFVVPYEHALKLREALPEAELVTFTDKGHFLQAEFPELVELIKRVG